MASKSSHINTDYYCCHSIVAADRITDPHSQHIAIDLGSNELGHAHHSRTDCSGHHNIFIDLIADTIMQLRLNCHLPVQMAAHHHQLHPAKTFRKSWALLAVKAIITVVNQRTSTLPFPNQKLLIGLVQSLSQGPHHSFSL